jgi:adenine-specific DNA-methyltransferase
VTSEPTAAPGSAPSGPDTPQLRKARGAFFTPVELCRYLAGWAIRGPQDAVLEPSCGEAAFLLAAAEQLTALSKARSPGAGSGAGGAGLLHGVDVHPGSARTARRLLAGTGHPSRITVADFFTLPPQPTYDVVIGNPPFVRYQDFTGEARALSRQAALRAGVNLTRLASSWAAFTVHSTLFLRPGGRLALVLPAELLSVNYAAGVRQFLMRRFGRVRLVLFAERIFPGVLEEVVLLLAEGSGGTSHCELQQVRGIDELIEQSGGAVSTWRPAGDDGKWTSAMLPAAAREVLAGIAGHLGTATLHTWGETTLGAVTGNNRYFARSPEQVRAAGLDPERDLVPLSPPGSRHLRGLAFGARDWTALGEQGKATWLFRPAADPSPAGRQYIAAGERIGVPDAYKCRVRTPWWRVPLVPPADLLLTYMNADTPRLSTNRAGVRHLNSVHGVYLGAGLRRLGTELLPLACLNSLTLLGAETVGRAYGGGMLKIEPREADRLPVPAPDLVRRLRPELLAVRAGVLRALGAGRLLDAVALVDEVVLAAGLGLPAADTEVIRRAREHLAGRRAARSGRPAGSLVEP